MKKYLSDLTGEAHTHRLSCVLPQVEGNTVLDILCQI